MEDKETTEQPQAPARAPSDGELIGVCSECHSDNPDSYVENNGFYQTFGPFGGQHIPCKFCNGRLIFVSRAQRDARLSQEDSKRGL